MTLPPSAPRPAPCPETGLPGLAALTALLDRGPEPFHVVVVRVELGSARAACQHLLGVLAGRGVLYRVDTGLLVALLPASFVDGGRLFVQALAQRPGPRLRLALATGTWLGGCHPLQTVRDVYHQLGAAPSPALQGVPRAPTPAAGMAALPVVRARREEAPVQKMRKSDDELEIIKTPHLELWG